MRIKAIILPVLAILLFSCQKENLTTLPQETNYAKNVKKHYDIVKAYHNSQIVERDGISLSLDQALDEIEMLFSYAYGIYSFNPDSTYIFKDTVNMTFTATPINTDDFVSLTNQALSIGQAQYNRISYNGTKYFYSMDLQKLSSTSTSATVAVRTVFSIKHNLNDDFTPVGQWPTAVFDNKFNKTYYDDYHECGHPTNSPNFGGEQAPDHITAMINKNKAYLNYDPIIAIQQEQTNPYDLLVLVNDTLFKGSSERKRFTTGGDHNEEFYRHNNHWDTLLHQRNPNDITLNDCVNEYNCFKIWTPVNQEYSSTCDENTRHKCLSPEECNHYYNRLMHCILNTKNFYGYSYFMYMLNDNADGVCIDSFCSYWWRLSIVLADQEFIQTKPDDLRSFPEPI